MLVHQSHRGTKKINKKQETEKVVTSKSTRDEQCTERERERARECGRERPRKSLGRMIEPKASTEREKKVG